MSFAIQKGSLLSSERVVWNTSDNLGRGASAVVYLGRIKQDGTKVAVKVFHDHIRMVAGGDEVRELELLQRLKHENIISLFSIERELVTKRVVLVMEYCEGGSLYHMLDQPQYVYGLPEPEFLLVLKHVATGISYLRQKGIIHRDIKPGNIMRFITEDGKSVYKLTDFGAARELNEEEKFTSIYGTEEYLHPGMYERAVLCQPTGQRFDAKVDLWSLGVTFYHVATGDLPFKPYGGRANREKMFEIISQKASGDISGVQNFDQGPITWSKELPKTCPLSSGLQHKIVPLLAALMENDDARIISYDKFFNIVHRLTHKMTISVFSAMSCQIFKLYIDEDNTLSSIQDHIASQTDLPAKSQLLLVDGRPLEEVVDPREEVSTYPNNLLRDNLFLFSSDLNSEEREKLIHPAIPGMTEFSNDIYNDARTAHRCTGKAHLVRRHASWTVQVQELLVRAEKNLRQYLNQRLKSAEDRFLTVAPLLEQLKKRSEIFYSMLDMVRTLHHVISCPVSSFDELAKDKTLVVVLDKAVERIEEIKSYKKALVDRLVEDESRVKKWSVRCKDTDCLSTVDHHVSVITGIHNRFRRDKNVREQMTQHDRNIHEYERQKLQDECVAIASVLQDHCYRNLDIMYLEAKIFLRERLKNLNRVSKIEKNISSVIECQQLLSSKLVKVEVKCRQAYETAQAWIQGNHCTPSGQLELTTGHLGSCDLGLGTSVVPSLDSNTNRTGKGLIRDSGVGVTCSPVEKGDTHNTKHKDTLNTNCKDTKHKDSLKSVASDLSNELHSLMVESKEIVSLVEENTQVIKLLEAHALHSSGSLSRNLNKK